MWLCCAIIAGLLQAMSANAQQASWMPQSMLSQSPEAYSDAALASSSGFVRESLLIEKRRSEYYEALYSKDYTQAYSRLAKGLRTRITPQEFELWFERSAGLSVEQPAPIKLERISNIRLLREYLAEVNRMTSKISIMSLSMESSFEGKEGAPQTVVLLDAWTISEGDAWVIPGDLAAITVSEASPEILGATLQR